MKAGLSLQKIMFLSSVHNALKVKLQFETMLIICLWVSSQHRSLGKIEECQCWGWWASIRTAFPTIRTLFKMVRLNNSLLIVKLRQGSGKVRQGKARKGKDGERWKALKLKPLPRAYTKVGCHPPPPPTHCSHFSEPPSVFYSMYHPPRKKDAVHQPKLLISLY